MAQVSSGSFTTSGYEGRALKFSWSVDSTSISGNYKKIYWSVVGTGGDSGYFYRAGNFKVVIDGEVVYEKDQDYRIDLWQGTVVASGYKTLYHNNTGNKSFSASVEAGIYTYARNCSGSGSWELETIPRYGTSNQSLKAKAERGITINWSSDNTVDYLWYSTDGGTTWKAIGSVNATSGTYTITTESKNTNNLSPNTTYNVITRIRRKDSQLTTDSSNLAITTYDYPHITNVGTVKLTIGNSQTLTIYNPLSRTVTIKMYKNSTSGTQLYSGTTSSTSITFTPTASTLYASIPNNKSSDCVYSCIYSTSTRTTTGAYYYLVNEANCIPTFSNFTYKDTNSVVTGVTGNNQVLVKGLSSLQVTISSANKMIAKNSATGSKYIAVIDTLNKTVNYSTSDINLDIGTVINSGTKRLTVTAYDSRTIPKDVYKDITVYDYAKPVINASITRLNNFEAETTIKVNGTYTRLTIGGVDKNTITSVKYRYREAGDTWGDWTNLNTTVTNGKFTCNNVVLSLDNTKSFEFEIQAVDKLQTNTGSVVVDVGQAIFFVSTNNRACYINGEMIKLGYREPAKLVNGDYNTMCGTESGFFRSTSTTNAPYTQSGQNSSSNWFYIIHIAHNSKYQLQIASPFFNNGLFFRHNVNGTWGAWKQISYTDVS